MGELSVVNNVPQGRVQLQQLSSAKKEWDGFSHLCPKPARCQPRRLLADEERAPSFPWHACPHPPLTSLLQCGAHSALLGVNKGRPGGVQAERPLALAICLPMGLCFNQVIESIRVT